MSITLEQLSYSVGSSLYFSANNRDASFENLEGEAIKRTEAKLKPVHGGNHMNAAVTAFKYGLSRYDLDLLQDN